MKNLIMLLFVFLFQTGHHLLSAQENRLFSKQELIEDADFYFNTVLKNHPDPYFYCSQKEYEQKKRYIYSQITGYQTRNDFMWLIGKMNTCMDYHTWINLSFYNPALQVWDVDHSAGKNQKVFPMVRIENGGIYCKSDRKNREIENINGFSADTILFFLQSYCNPKLSEERDRFNMEGMFAPYMELFFNIRAPFVVKYKGKKKEEIVNGINYKEYINQSGMHAIDLTPDNIIDYDIYPASSTAILVVNSFTERYLKRISEEMTNFMDSINKYDIKYLFLNLSLNGGGQRCFDLLDIIQHDTIYESYKGFYKENDQIKKYEKRDIVRLPNRNKYGKERQLFVIQGINTRSCADYFCRIIKENQLGVLVGQNTGEPTADFTFVHFYETPHTKILFTVATAYRDYSRYFPDKTLHPDIYWDVNYWGGKSQKILFSEKELKEIIKEWEKKKKKITF